MGGRWMWFLSQGLALNVSIVKQQNYRDHNVQNHLHKMSYIILELSLNSSAGCWSYFCKKLIVYLILKANILILTDFYHINIREGSEVRGSFLDERTRVGEDWIKFFLLQSFSQFLACFSPLLFCSSCRETLEGLVCHSLSGQIF